MGLIWLVLSCNLEKGVKCIRTRENNPVLSCSSISEKKVCTFSASVIKIWRTGASAPKHGKSSQNNTFIQQNHHVKIIPCREEGLYDKATAAVSLFLMSSHVHNAPEITAAHMSKPRSYISQTSQTLFMERIFLSNQKYIFLNICIKGVPYYILV